MRYLHYVIDQNNNQIESLYSNIPEPRFSIKCFAKIKKATYRIWDRQTGEIEIVKISNQ
jgi:hypothetical protein